MDKHEYKENADQYDKQVKEYDSHGHEVLFGMSFEYVNPDEKILDLGIGTGLASINFSKIGLKVYGLDFSDDMLNACRTKSFAEELKLHNLSDDKIPYTDDYFNHIICSGVFHFLGDLENIFSEVSRIITERNLRVYFRPGSGTDEYKKQMTSWGVPIYQHSPDYIMKLLDDNGMTLLKRAEAAGKGADKISYDMLFSVMIAKYK